jgi:hypothetical protein
VKVGVVDFDVVLEVVKDDVIVELTVVVIVDVFVLDIELVALVVRDEVMDEVAVDVGVLVAVDV